MAALNLLIGCNDRYYIDILNRGLVDATTKLFNREDYLHTTSEFIIPFLSFASRVVFLIDEPKMMALFKHIKFEALYKLFHNRNIPRVQALVLDIFMQFVQKEIDGEMHTNLLLYLVEKQFISELFELFEGSNFDFKVVIVEFISVLMSSKYDYVYTVLVSGDANYFNVCGQFCTSCMDPKIFKRFLETMLNIWEVAVRLDETKIISEMAEELNDQIAEFVNNNEERS